MTKWLPRLIFVIGILLLIVGAFLQFRASAFIVQHDVAGLVLVLGVSFVMLSFAPALFSPAAPENAGRRTLAQIGYLAVFFGVLTIGYFQAGVCMSGDGSGHLDRVQTMFEVLNGQGSMWWSNHWYAGYPFLSFYGPLFFVFTGAINFIFRNVCLTTQSVLWVLHILSGLAMFFFLKKILSNAAAALVGSLAYVIALQHFITIADSAFPVSVHYVLFPCLMYVFEKFRRNEWRRPLAVYLGGVICAAMIAAHVQYGAVAAILFGVSIVLTGLFNARTGSTKSLISEAAVVIGIALLAGILTLWIWVEFATGRSAEVMLSNSSTDLLFAIPKSADIKELLNSVTWSWGFSGFTINYLGFSTILLALAGIIYFFRTRKTDITYLLIGFVLATIFTILNTRAGNFLVFYLAIFAALGSILVSELFKQPIARYVVVGLCIVMLLDLTPGLLAPLPNALSWSYRGVPTAPDVLSTVRAEANDGRFMTLTQDHRSLWESTENLLLHESTIFGHAPQDATKGYSIEAAIAMHASQEMFDQSGKLSQDSLDGLCLLGIRHVFIHANETSKFPQDQLIEFPSNGALLFAPTTQQASLTNNALWHETLWTVNDKYLARTLDWSAVQPLIQGMHLDCQAGTAQQIYVQDGANGTASSDTTPTLHVTSFQENASSVAATFEVNEDGYIQLAYSYYPDLEIKIDGQVTQKLRTTTDFVAFPVKKGQHSLEAVYQPAGITLIALAVSIIVLVVGALFVLVVRRQNKPTKVEAVG